MKPHKHAEIIKAWADGAEVQIKTPSGNWVDYERIETPLWNVNNEYRIKPEQETKPDYEKYIAFDSCEAGGMTTRLRDISDINPNCWQAIIKITFDGKTNKAKSAYLLKEWV